ncbi:MAG: Asp-tRNA(Asn)/Glu-tRNA(Gln) amidotransferase GatCAB subunit B, partial [Minisyncoccia bacterium]
AKDLLLMTISENADPEELAKTHNLFQSTSTSDLAPIIEALLTEHASVALDFKNGKAAALEFLVGQGMKALRGAADPALLRKLISEAIQKN